MLAPTRRLVWLFAPVLALAGTSALAAAPAQATSSAAAMPSEGLLLAQVVVLVLLGRLFGELMYRIGQPSILGQIIGGILLGPTVLGGFWPEGLHLLFPGGAAHGTMIEGIAQIGILFLLLLAGMETDLGLAYKLRRAALGVSLSGIAVPFVCGFALGWLIPQNLLPEPGARLVTALFLGTALSISSLKIVATVVREMNFMRRNIGQLIVASAVIDDTVGWVIIAITFSLATSGAINMGAVAFSVLGTLAFLAVSFTVGRRAVFEIIRWTNDSLHSDLPMISAIIGIMGVMALITQWIGVQTVLGAFVAGLLIGQSPILTRQIDEQLRGLTTSLFMPVFFGLTGLHTDLRVLGDPETLALAVGLVLIASVGKFGGAFLGARINKLSFADALALGFGMNARGSTEVIVASIGLSVGVLDQRLFSVIVAMAVVTTLIMPPTLRWALARLPLKGDEQDRLEREEFDKSSYVGQLERILAAVDSSDSGRLATQLAGNFAGLRNMPVTVLSLGEEEKSSPVPEPPPAAPVNKSGKRKAAKPAPEPVAPEVEPTPTDAAIEQVKAAAREAAAAAREDDDSRNGEVRVGRTLEQADLETALSAESKKGHDLLFIGTDPLTSPEGGFDPRIGAMLGAFERTGALVSARGQLRRDPDATIRILIPVSGDIWSMRAAEFAFVLAKALGARVAALFVPFETRARSVSRVTDAQYAHRAVFDSVKRIAEFYGVEVRTIVGQSVEPELAILSQARQGRYNLIVLGVGARATEKLSFGKTADALLESSDRSLVYFVAT